MKENMKEKIMNFVKNKKNLSICGGVLAAIVALVIVIVLVSSKSNKNDINNSTTLNANVDEKTSISKEDETTLNKEDESTTVEDLLDETTSKDLVDETTEIPTNTQGQPITQPQKTAQGQPITQPQKTAQGQPITQTQTNTQGQPITQTQKNTQVQPTTQQPTTTRELTPMEKYEQATIVSQAEAKAAINSGAPVYTTYNTGYQTDPNPFTLLVPTTRYVAYQDANGNVKKANMKGYYAAWSGSKNPSFGCTYQESYPEIYEPRREAWELANIGKLSNGYQQVGYYDRDSNYFTNCIVFYYYFD